MQLLGNVVLLLLLVNQMFTLTSAEIYYVTPIASIPCPEKGVPCHTFSHYATSHHSYFSSSVVFILLNGHHTLDSQLLIENVASLTVFTKASSPSNTTISCSELAMFSFRNIKFVYMKGLHINGCVFNSIVFVDYFIIENCNLQGQRHNGTEKVLDNSNNFSSHKKRSPTTESDTKGAVLLTVSYSKNALISNCTFSNNTVIGLGVAGGAVTVVNSNVTVNDSAFADNIITGPFGQGAALLAVYSSVTIINSTFVKNVIFLSNKYGFGGGVSAMHSSITIQNCAFISNAVLTTNSTTNNGRSSMLTLTQLQGGGALFAYAGTLVINSSTFISNTVNGDKISGGAILTLLSGTTINMGSFINNSVTGNIVQGGAITHSFT